MISILRILLGVVLAAVSLVSMAAVVDITAEFSPSLANPTNNEFINTTPISGFCSNSKGACTDDVGIMLPITAQARDPLLPEGSERDGVYFRVPSKIRDIELRNVNTGEIIKVKFRVHLIAVRYSPNVGGFRSWGEDGKSNIGYPENTGSNGCSSSSGVGTILEDGENWAEFGWFIGTHSTGCHRKSGLKRDNMKYSEISIGYLLQAPNPLKMAAGVYVGEKNFLVGANQDFDFGDNFQASDPVITMRFTLTVTHELKVEPIETSKTVLLHPCALGKQCSEDEGKNNWERWMVTGIVPSLTGKKDFNISSSGFFSVYLQCEHQSGSDCALQSDNNPSLQMPVQTLLTLPTNIVDEKTGATVIKKQLSAGRDPSRNTFITRSFARSQKGSIDFLIPRRDVETLLKTRADTYRGAVTVIFDPQI